MTLLLRENDIAFNIFEADGQFYAGYEAADSVEAGPCESRGQAWSMAYTTVHLGARRLPQPTQRYMHRNGAEYTVLALANEHSEKAEYPLEVVYQGDNGRVWSKTMKDFVQKMTYLPPTEPVPVITDTGGVVVEFRDSFNERCVLQEANTNGHVLLSLEKDLGSLIPSYIAIDGALARKLVPYLLYLMQNGELPSTALPPEWMYGALEGDERLDYQRLLAITSQPETWDFVHAVVAESALQAQQYSEDDDEKRPAAWAFLFGQLAGKATEAANLGDEERVRHHATAACAAMYQLYARFGGESQPDLFTIRK